MAPKIEISDEEIDNAEEFGSESDELSDVELDDDEEAVPEEEEDEEDDELEGLYPEDLENYEPETRRNTRPTRRRQLTFYDEDDFSEEEPPKKVSVKLKIPRRTKETKPDVLRMTERQRARLEEDGEDEELFAKMDEQLLALNRKTAKKKETAEQMAVRKAENARRRAHYKTKQLEEEKRDTLNKLLKRRATKTREKMVDDLDVNQTLKPRRPAMNHPALIRWVCRPESSVLAMAENVG